mmetsp:Transcript_19958/g.33780  ORF Transcript_19958/g.33780 Transcript_19958/m.33780 type:complete len:112 (-) Transcript_19958:1494-1829(-)
MVDVQYWQVTKALPPIPVINLNADSPAAVFTSPVNIVGIPQIIKTAAEIKRAPYMSQNSPERHRVTTAPATLQMELVQISSLDKFNDVCISDNSGVAENHARNAKKKVNQA